MLLFIRIIQHYLLSALKNMAHWTGSQHLTIVNYELWLNNSAQWCSQLAGGWSCPHLGIAPRLFTQVSSSSRAVAEIKIRFSAAASRLRYVKWQFFSHSVMDPICDIIINIGDIIDIGVWLGFCINKKNGKVHSLGLQSPNIGYATLSQNEVIWIFCNHRNKKLKQLSLPTNSLQT